MWHTDVQTVHVPSHSLDLLLMVAYTFRKCEVVSVLADRNACHGRYPQSYQHQLAPTAATAYAEYNWSV